jgi:Spy/CpxP family protein refolding chaperone
MLGSQGKKGIYESESQTSAVKERILRGMKKRILALLLAGLLTASMVSCVASSDQDEPGNDTEEEQNYGDDTTNKEDNTIEIDELTEEQIAYMNSWKF